MTPFESTRYFRHFKGKYYRLVCIASHSESLQPMVVYQALYGDRQIWVRPYNMFFETIQRDGVTMPRFQELTDEQARSLNLNKQ